MKSGRAPTRRTGADSLAGRKRWGRPETLGARSPDHGWQAGRYRCASPPRGPVPPEWMPEVRSGAADAPLRGPGLSRRRHRTGDRGSSSRRGSGGDAQQPPNDDSAVGSARGIGRRRGATGWLRYDVGRSLAPACLVRSWDRGSSSGLHGARCSGFSTCQDLTDAPDAKLTAASQAMTGRRPSVPHRSPRWARWCAVPVRRERGGRDASNLPRRRGRRLRTGFTAVLAAAVARLHAWAGKRYKAVPVRPNRSAASVR
ncbi:hypothetical protein EES40_35750 [Streptomyces sp. ADI93-02]|nr:hypothetical protein EES40_35750 [Streptomyces sp. ADI93-02]